MDRKRFNELQNMVDEMKELEDFIPIFESGYNPGLMATKQSDGGIGMSVNSVRELYVIRGSALYELIVGALKNRLQTLEGMLDEA